MRLVVGWPGGGVAVDEPDALVEQVNHGGVERTAGRAGRHARCPVLIAS
jgi:hypothetical protein